MDTATAIENIIRLNEHIHEFWSSCHGWAPKDAADLLSAVRLDHQAALSRTLKMWLVDGEEEETAGRLILAWANLGTLVEGTMKWFLCVFRKDYTNNPLANHRGEVLEPDILFFSKLNRYFTDHVWTAEQVKSWSSWLDHIRQRRNAIHAFQDHDIGSFNEFRKDVCLYCEFLMDLHGRVPYPDGYGWSLDGWACQD